MTGNQLSFTKITWVSRLYQVPDFVPPDIFVRGLRFLGSLTRPVLTVLLVMLTGLVGVLDYFIGSNATFVSLYLIPMAMAAWLLGLRFSFLIAGLSTLFWVLGDIGAGIEAN